MISALLVLQAATLVGYSGDVVWLQTAPAPAVVAKRARGAAGITAGTGRG